MNYILQPLFEPELASRKDLPAVHVAKHNGMCADTGRRIEGMQGANCFEVCIYKFCLAAI